jgi:hypothetical protein
MVVGQHLDMKYNKVDVVSDEILNPNKSKNGQKLSEDIQFIEATLPEVFSSKPFSARFLAETKRYHRWFGIIFYYTPQFPRVLRVVSLATAILIMLFTQALTYNVAYPDDGTCEENIHRTSCEDEPSAIARNEEKCYWDSETRSCHYLEPGNDILRVFTVAIISAVIGAPIMLTINWMVMNVLSCKTKAKGDVSKINPELISREKRGAQIERNRRISKACDARDSSFRSPERKTVVRRITLAVRNIFTTDVQNEINELNDLIRRYRSTLSIEDIVEFDGKQLLCNFISYF